METLENTSKLEMENVESIVFSPHEDATIKEEFDEEKIDSGLFLDDEEFLRGTKIGSYVAGIYASIVSMGVPENIAGDMVMNERTIEHNMAVMQLESKQRKKNALKDTIEEHLSQL